ncbi:putative mis12-mtw1 family protein [Phaeomoniella chlamydospora]|uniref:Putative mis12-mtw1 family protein n=1 Tax=Phaeomoniella chlamydospora TaxID=158046 RepID=A0A0G2EEZ3_PHACM|nr:putative mis12-mtw1 family protein [Phaeomoniella chlamydospora]
MTAEKDDPGVSLVNCHHTTQQHGKQNATSTTKSGNGRRGTEGAAIAKKRKLDYDEEVEGFAFTRAKARKPRATNASVTAIPEVGEEAQINAPSKRETRAEATDNGREGTSTRIARKKMEFSTPNAEEKQVVRRSRRISGDEAQQGGSPKRQKRKDDKIDKEGAHTEPSSKGVLQARPHERPTAETTSTELMETKIALPFADTPVIRRNKAMRDGRASKGERRSSLGMRGRRATLPHNEVKIEDFYKHIESEGLPEPRRMRQLLTWCATRAMGEISTGKEFEDQSARLAARVIQEELLKDLSDKSEMSDWFNREDIPPPKAPVLVKPNPKNLQNEAKILELEEQIKRFVLGTLGDEVSATDRATRLKAEKVSLEALKKPPAITPMPSSAENPAASSIDTSLLSPSDLEIQQLLTSTPTTSTIVSARLNSIISSLGPTVDVFADGVHKIGQYRDAAERVATRALNICAKKLEERDRASLRQTRGDEIESQKRGRESMGGVLRGLSRLES